MPNVMQCDIIIILVALFFGVSPSSSTLLKIEYSNRNINQPFTNLSDQLFSKNAKRVGVVTVVPA